MVQVKQVVKFMRIQLMKNFRISLVNMAGLTSFRVPCGCLGGRIPVFAGHEKANLQSPVSGRSGLGMASSCSS